MRNYQIREHFLTKIFTFTDFRKRKSSENPQHLKDFHEHNRLLFKCYDEDLYQDMDEILRKDVDVSKRYDLYEKNLYRMFDSPPDGESRIELMNEIFNDLKNKIGKDEIVLFKVSIEDYKKGKTSLREPLSLLHSWLIRFKDEDRKDQSFFYPYPKDLFRLEDIKPCISRDYQYF